jgi:DNA-binding CsgD family transcriptional regulator
MSSEHLGEASEKIAGLSSREKEILQCVSDGLSSKEIARKLDISHKTVEVHRANIRKKLGLKSIAELTKVFCDLR